MSAQIRVGDLRERVSIRSLSSSADGKGGFTEAFTSVLATVWAKIDATSGAERVQAMQQEHARTYDVTIRYLSTVTPRMRLVLDDSRVLKITGTKDPTLRRRWLVLSCVEEDAA